MRVTMHVPSVLRQHAGGQARLPVELVEPASLACLLDRLRATTRRSGAGYATRPARCADTSTSSSTLWTSAPPPVSRLP